MGERGPGKTPTRIRQLHGETRPSQLGRNEPQPGGAPRMPNGMDPASQRVWRRIVRDYGATGVLTAVDSDILRLFCDAVARYDQAQRLLAESSPLLRRRNRSRVSSKDGEPQVELVKNPLHQIVRDNAALVRTLARELGLTPSSRAGLGGNEPPAGDPLASFLSETG